jgi:hypothetical protein
MRRASSLCSWLLLALGVYVWAPRTLHADQCSACVQEAKNGCMQECAPSAPTAAPPPCLVRCMHKQCGEACRMRQRLEAYQACRADLTPRCRRECDRPAPDSDVDCPEKCLARGCGPKREGKEEKRR